MCPDIGLSGRRTFDECAVFYDGLTAHHDYDHWTTVLEGAAIRHGLKGKRLLDLACGTGKSFLPMLERGYEVTACDISDPMLEHARRKCDGRAAIRKADMRDLPDLGRFDFVTCIDEPLNYLLSKAEVRRAFRSAAGCLAEGGVYLFDLNTLHTYRSIFAACDCYESDGWLFVWRGEGDGRTAPDRKATVMIEAFGPNGGEGWRRISNRHVQRHYTHEFVVDALASAGLTCVATYGQHPDGTLEDEVDELGHTKRIYLSRPTT
jgi:SAM-dependent methyltransferase